MNDYICCYVKSYRARLQMKPSTGITSAGGRPKTAKAEVDEELLQKAEVLLEVPRFAEGSGHLVEWVKQC